MDEQQLQRSLEYLFHIFAIAFSASHEWLPDVHTFISFMSSAEAEIGAVDAENINFLVAYSQAALRCIFSEPANLVLNMSLKKNSRPRAMTKRMKERLLLDLVATQFNQIFAKFFADSGRPEKFVPFVVPPVIPAQRTLLIYQLYGFSDEQQEKLMTRANKGQAPMWMLKQLDEKIKNSLHALKPFCYESIVVRDRAFPKLIRPSQPDQDYLQKLVAAATPPPATPGPPDRLAQAIQEAGLDDFLDVAPGVSASSCGSRSIERVTVGLGRESIDETVLHGDRRLHSKPGEGHDRILEQDIVEPPAAGEPPACMVSNQPRKRHVDKTDMLPVKKQKTSLCSCFQDEIANHLELVKRSGGLQSQCITEVLIDMCKEIDVFAALASDADTLFACHNGSRRDFTTGIVFQKLQAQDKFRSIPTYLKLIREPATDHGDGFKRPAVDEKSFGDRLKKVCAFFSAVNGCLESAVLKSQPDVFHSIGKQIGACLKRLKF